MRGQGAVQEKPLSRRKDWFISDNLAQSVLRGG
jgi:hypothetical protein